MTSVHRTTNFQNVTVFMRSIHLLQWNVAAHTQSIHRFLNVTVGARRVECLNLNVAVSHSPFITS
jgi:hypothetical protein